MPLSEHEQRVLRQIERQFEHERGLRVPGDARDAVRTAKRAALGFLIGLVALVVSFASSWLVGAVGFVAMLVALVALVQSMRRLLEDRWLRAAARQEQHAGTAPADATLWQALGWWRARRRPDPPEGGEQG